MAVYFEGTSTGNRYEVGKTYEMGGREYTAQSDGSFVREGSRAGFSTDSGRVVRENDGGHRVTGSSQDGGVRWFVSGADASASGRYSPGAAIASAGGSSRDSEGGIVADPNGGVMYRMPAPSAARFRAAAQDYVRQAAWSGKDDPPQDLLFGGMHLRAHSGYTNAELSEARYSDFMSSVIGIPIFGADIGNTLAHRMGSEYYGSGRPGVELAQHRLGALSRIADDKARDAGEAALGGMMSLWDGLREWGAAEQAKERREAMVDAELRDVWGLRDELEAAEAAKVETPRRSQAILGGMGVFSGL